MRGAIHTPKRLREKGGGGGEGGGARKQRSTTPRGARGQDGARPRSPGRRGPTLTRPPRPAQCRHLPMCQPQQPRHRQLRVPHAAWHAARGARQAGGRPEAVARAAKQLALPPGTTCPGTLPPGQAGGASGTTQGWCPQRPRRRTWRRTLRAQAAPSRRGQRPQRRRPRTADPRRSAGSASATPRQARRVASPPRALPWPWVQRRGRAAAKPPWGWPAATPRP